MTIEWRRIFDVPFNHQSHVFVRVKPGVAATGVCWPARRHARKMKPTQAPTRALDTCPICAMWLRRHGPAFDVAAE